MGKQAKKWRIDLVLFINGFPVATLELKSEFKQAVQNAMLQYKRTRLPKDPETNKPEPLLMFKRGALVHFAVSQYEVYMATQLAGEDTFFLPFNKGTHDGGAGNDVPEDQNQYATAYLWNEVLTPDNLLNIIARFVHPQIEEKENWAGRTYKKELLIFPRYHQWNVVTKLIKAALEEGTGQKYLIQHSAGSGKSNSIAWTAHQLSTLYDQHNQKLFDSVIVVTDRTILDAQLQDTIYQFEHADGVVGRINNKEGDGSKSEKLAKALETSQPIIIVTIQTFPFVLRAIENSTNLKQRRYAVIADEAHSSQSGSTARQLKEVLMLEEREEDAELSSEDILDAVVAAVDVPVTLKTRLGFLNGHENILRVAKRAEESGIAALALHGRTREDMYLNTARYELIKQVKQLIDIPLIANGDIDSPEKAKYVLDYTGADAIMIGRAAQGRPWIFREIAHYLKTGEHLAAPDIAEVKAVLLGHLAELYAFYGEYSGCRIARKHIAWYTKGLRLSN